MDENKEQHAPEPDYESTLVWSDDDERNVGLLLKTCGGDVDEALKRLFQSGGGTDYASARLLSIRFAKSMGLSEVEFMQKYRRWKKGKPLSR